MAGYSATPLFKKLGIKEGFTVGLVNAPESFVKDLGKLPAKSKTSTSLTDRLDLIILFAKTAVRLENQFAILAEKLPANGSLWVAWPKKSSGVSTDLSFNLVQKIGLNCGLVDVKICAIDETWSGLKFVYRVKDRSQRPRLKIHLFMSQLRFFHRFLWKTMWKSIDWDVNSHARSVTAVHTSMEFEQRESMC